MKFSFHFLFLSFIITSACNGQESSNNSSTLVGGPCQGCEAVMDYGNRKLTNEITIEGYETALEKLHITGTILKKDGATPAKNVLLYIYHTDETGIYPKKETSTGLERWHGYLRGWLKTGQDGSYTIKTFRPGSYPSRDTPQHIHPTIKEPNINEYYIHDFMFADDPLLPETEKNKKNYRGGSGILSLTKENGIWVGKRDIILGEHIPDYPN